MSTTKTKFRVSRTAMALAMLGVFGPAYADDTTLADLTTPTNFVAAGVDYVSGSHRDRSLFTQFNGLHDDAYLNLDFGYVKRDEATGTWTIVEARDLGLDTRELRGVLERQGDWKIYGDYSGIVRWYPRTINTGEQGAGTTTPLASLLPVPGTGNDIDLKTERRRANIGGQKWLGRNWMVEANFANEDKSGARIFGRGFTCASSAAPPPICTALASGASQYALLLLPEPIDFNTKQIDARVNYLGDRFALSASYYGSFFTNYNGTLDPTVVGNLNNPLGVPMGTGGGVPLTPGLRGILQLPMALPPDNQSHQFALQGNYAFTQYTRANFKYAYSEAKQNEDWGSVGLGAGPSGQSNLGGKFNISQAQAGITSRVLPKLNVLADVRYYDRQDKTPIDFYNVEGTSTWTNARINYKKTNGKAEASYLFPADYRATVGFDYELIDRGEIEDTDVLGGISGVRQKTYERGYRAELFHTMSDTLTGRILFNSSKRDGSTWLKPLGSGGVLPADPDCVSATVGGVPNACIASATGIFPYSETDRRRNKVRVLGDWSPMERLSVELGVDYGKDKYDSPSINDKGLRDTDVRLVSLDAVYALSNALKLTAYYSYTEQTLHVAHSTGYILDFKEKNHTAGVGLQAKPAGRIQWGADLLYIHDDNVYNTGLDSGASAQNIAFFNQSGGVPDVTFRDFRLKLYGSYAIDRASSVQVEVVHDRQKLNEWTWGANGVPFVYSDGTTVVLKPDQNVTFVSLMYVYKWR